LYYCLQKDADVLYADHERVWKGMWTSSEELMVNRLARSSFIDRRTTPPGSAGIFWDVKILGAVFWVFGTIMVHRL
jgi:hypothetical protein